MSQAVNLTPDLHLFGLNKEVKFLSLFLTILRLVFTKLLLIIFIFTVPLNERNLYGNDVSLVCDSLVGFLGQYFRAITGW